MFGKPGASSIKIAQGSKEGRAGHGHRDREHQPGEEVPAVTSPITAEARKYVKVPGHRGDGVHLPDRARRAPRGLRRGHPGLHRGRARPGRLPTRVRAGSGSCPEPRSITVSDTDVYRSSPPQLSIPWDSPEVILRYDVVTITSAPQDSQIVGKQYEIQTVAKAGELRATRRFEVTGIM